MSKKKKIILFIALIVTVVTLGIIIGVTLSNKDSKPKEPEKTETKKEESTKEDEISLKEDLTFSLNANIPTVQDFVTENAEGTLTIYLEDKEYQEETLTKVGTYKVTIKINDETYETTFKVLDTEKPELKLKEVTITEGSKYTVKSFITSCTDNSNEDCLLSFTQDEMAKYTKVGTYDIEITAKDSSENATNAKTKLTIKAKNNSSKTENPTSSSSTTTEDVASISYKYGVKITTTETVTYKVNSDGTKTEISRKTKKTSYDKSTFKATTAELTPEATSNAKKYSAQINEVLKYVNEYRAEVGASPLVLDNDLIIAANVRATEMAWSEKFSHTRPDGTSCFTVSPNKAFAENIAYGWGGMYSTAKSVSEGWKASPGHYQNMIDSGYQTIGIGMYNLNGTYYWVQLFGY